MYLGLIFLLSYYNPKIKIRIFGSCVRSDNCLYQSRRLLASLLPLVAVFWLGYYVTKGSKTPPIYLSALSPLI